MALPGLQEVERERVGVFGGEQRVAELHHRGIAGVLERVELSAPRTAQAARVVQLQLSRLGDGVVQEQRGKQLEVVLHEGRVFGGLTVFLVPRVALGVHAPVLAAQSGHDAQSAKLHVGRGVEGMHVVAVDEPVEEVVVFHQLLCLPVLLPRLLRGVLMREAPVVAGL